MKPSEQQLMPDLQLTPPVVRPFLPKSYRAIPLVALGVFLAGSVSSAYFFVQTTRARAAYSENVMATQDLTTQSATLRQKKDGLKISYQAAIRMRSWLEASRHMGGLLQDYFDRMPKDVVIDTFSVTRDVGSPVVTFDIFLTGDSKILTREYLSLQNYMRDLGYEILDPKAERGTKEGSFRFVLRMRSPVTLVSTTPETRRTTP
jgi:hypothetical protein